MYWINISKAFTPLEYKDKHLAVSDLLVCLLPRANQKPAETDTSHAPLKQLEGWAGRGGSSTQQLPGGCLDHQRSVKRGQNRDYIQMQSKQANTITQVRSV